MNEQLKSDLLKNEADEFWQDCERKAAELEVTVDYYLDEFLQTYITYMISEGYIHIWSIKSNIILHGDNVDHSVLPL